MPPPANHFPFGLRDVKVSPLAAGTGTPSAGIDVGAAQTLEFTATEEVETLRGDDGVVAVRGKGGVVNWTLDQGGITPAAYGAFTGSTVTSSGATPNQVHEIVGKNTDIRPYVQLEGQSIADEGGDFHGKLLYAKASGDISGTMADGTFWVTSIAGQAIGKPMGTDINTVYEFTWNETVTPIT